MEYTITDINSLRVKLLLLLMGMGLLYSLLYIYLVTVVPYNLTIKKQRDVLARRVLFFTGLFSLISAELFYIGEFLVNSWRPSMLEDDLSSIVSSLLAFVLPAAGASLLIYILTFWLCARFLRSVVGYKPWTVFVSRGKKFGLF